MSDAAGYHAFISYAHGRDEALAAALQREIRRFGVPFYLYRTAFPPAPRGTRRRPLRVFRDATDLGAAASLPDELRRAIQSSQWLVLLASPEAAASPWVREEVRAWLAKDPAAGRVLIALTGGRIVAAADGGIDPAATDALPAELVAALTHVPLWTDLTEAHGRRRLGDVVADLAAPIQGVDKDTLIGEQVRQQRRALRTALGAVALVTTLAVVASTLAVVAFRARGEAVRQRDTALANQLVAESGTIADTQPGLARQLLAAAGRIRRTPQVTGALVTGRSIPQEVQLDADQAAFSPDGQVVVLAKSGSEEDLRPSHKTPAVDGFLRLLDGKSLTAVGEIPLGWESVDGLAFVPGPGRRLAAGYGTQVRVWDVLDAAHPRELPSLALDGQGDGIDVLAFGGGRAATVDGGHELRLWDVADPGVPRLLGTATLPQLEERSFDRLAFSPDGRRLVLSGISRGPMFLDVTDPRRPRVLPDVPALAQVQEVAYAPEGGWLMTTGRETVPRRWRLAADGTPQRPVPLPLTEPGATVTGAAAGPQGQLAAVSEEGGVLVWNNALDADPPALVATLPIGTYDASNVDAPQFSPSGRQLMLLSPRANTGPGGAGRQLETMRIWQVADGRQPGAAKARPGGQAVAAHGDVLATVASGVLDLWDIREEGIPAPVGSLPLPNPVEGMAFNPSGNRLALWQGDDLTVVDTHDPSRPAVAGEWSVTGVAGAATVFPGVFRDDDVVAVGDLTQQVTLVDTSRPPSEGPAGVLTPHYGGVGELAVLRPPNGHTVLVTAGISTPVIELWDVSEPARARLIGATCGGGTLTKEGDDYYCRGGARVLGLATDSAGRVLAAADGAGTVRVWRLSGDELHPVATLADTGDVYGVALAPDGRRLATIGRDVTLRTYRVEADAVPLEAIVHLGVGAESKLAFAGDGHTLVGTMRYGLVDVWELDPEINTAALCGGSGPRITRAQWSRDIPGIRYAPPC
jgi:WD40 repeat protein